MKVTPYLPTNRHGNRGTWYAKWREDGRIRRKSLRTQDEDLARGICHKMERRLIQQEHGLEPDPDDHTWQDAWKQYAKLARTRKSGNTLNGERAYWKQFFVFCNAPMLRSVRRADVAEWQNYLLESGNNAVTVNDKTRACATVWNTLLKEEAINIRNPFAGRKKIDEGPRKLRYLPWEELEFLMMASRTRIEQSWNDMTFARATNKPCRQLERRFQAREAMHLTLILCVYAGCRKQESLAVRWEHIDWDKETIEIRGTKTEGSNAVICLNPTLADALRPYRQLGGYVIMPSVVHSNSPYRWNCRAEWEELREFASMPGTRLHDLRHTFATRLLELGRSLTEIASVLRHTSTRPTEIYADLRAVKVRVGRLDGKAMG